MGEFAGVDPHQVRLLANRLKDLADSIARDGSVIRSRFSKWDSTLNLSRIAQPATQIGQDAHDMARRADEALNLLHESPRISAPNDPHMNWVAGHWGVLRPGRREYVRGRRTERQRRMGRISRVPDSPGAGTGLRVDKKKGAKDSA